MSKHTKEPWEANGFSVFAPAPAGKDGIWEIASLYNSLYPENRIVDADRIVACVNACEGINPEAVGDLLEALKALASEAMGSVEYSDWPELQEAVERADVAIAKAEGSKEK